MFARNDRHFSESDRTSPEALAARLDPQAARALAGLPANDAQFAASFAADFNVANFSNTAYRFNATSNNPTLTLVRGNTYTFAVTASGHPFDIKTNIGNGSGNRYNVGVTGQGMENGTLTFIVPASGPNPLFYDCEVHNAMSGTINLISPPNTPPTINITSPIAGAILIAPTNVTIQATATDDGSVAAVLFLVDANTLTNDTAAPFAALTNNLSPGNHMIFAIATDNLGLKATNAISITVDTRPSVTVTNPPNGSVFAAPATSVGPNRAIRRMRCSGTV